MVEQSVEALHVVSSIPTLGIKFAPVAELADAGDLKSPERDFVWVRLPSGALYRSDCHYSDNFN